MALGDRYQLGAVLGEGSFGEVYAARDRLRGEDVAIKLLKRASPAAIVRFKREFRALRDLSHPNLIQLHDLVAEDPTWFFTMELVRGVDLASWLGNGVRVRRTVATGSDDDDAPARPPDTPIAELDGARLAAILVQLADGLDAVHRAGHLHCDLKPNNLLIESDGRLRVLDFGMVAAIGERASRSGTPWFAAPEQLAGERLSAASDWYGVGVTLYDVIAGRFPFSGTPDVIERDKRSGDAPPLAEVAPGVPAAVAELVDRLLARDPAARPGAGEVRARALAMSGDASAARVPSSASPASGRARDRDGGEALIGRDAELAALSSAWSRVAAGETMIARVLGGSGIGKTALIRGFIASVARRDRAGDHGADHGGHDDVWVLAGRSYEREQLPFRALDPVIDELAARLGALDDDERARWLPADAAYLGRLFPVLRPWTGTAAADGVPGEGRRRAFAAARALFAAVAAAVPAVLVLDDLQWGDADSGALLADIVRGPDSPPLLCIASCRSEDQAASPVLAALAGSGATTIDVAVGPLAPDAARTLARSLIGDRADADAVAGEANGSPFLVRELALADTALRGGRLTVDDVVRARVDALDARARALLVAVAVAGRPIDERAAAAASGQAAGAAEVARLRAASLLRVTAGGRTGADELDTYHDRIREAVIASLDTVARRAQHARLAAALLASSGDPLAVARHHRDAGDHAAACAAAHTAADAALAAGAPDRAAALYAFALDALDGADDARGARDPRDARGADDARDARDARGADRDPLRRTLRVGRAAALTAAGQSAAAAELYSALAASAPEPEATELRRRAAELLLTSGHLDAGMAQLAGVLDSIGLAVPRTPRRALASLVFHRAQLAVRGVGTRERPASALSPELLVRVDACWSVAVGLSMTDHIRGADFQARHLLAALAAGEPTRVARGLALEAIFSATAGGRGRARSRTLTARARAIALRTGDPLATAMLPMAEGVCAQQAGEWRLAADRCAEAIALLTAVPAAFHELANARFFWLESLIYLGEMDAVATAVPAIHDDALRRGDVYTLGWLDAGPPVFLWLWRDQPATALARVRAAAAAMSSGGFYVQHLGALNQETQALLHAGDAAGAYARVDRDWRALERSQLLRAQNVLIESLILRGRAALACGRISDATRDARRVRRERMPWGDALAGLLEAGIAPSPARWTAAATALDRCDMRLHAAAARLRATAPAPGDPSLPTGLVAMLAPTL